jgi:hypothetical protein
MEEVERTSSEAVSRGRQIGNGIVALVTPVFASLIAILVPAHTTGFAGLLVIIGGGIAVGLGVTAAASRDDELATTLGVWGAIFGVVAIIVGISLVGYHAP